ncbi:mitochondrial ribosomal protein subunit S18 [Boletus reticuloceps]|uniref:Mitochondrial ribosomal protein subunit S18 n=1 Tax=Boletus reticuloceps TaxID=495285 RepID=A0A8I2YTA9_9AGAM|nr:mitochondrial ribosomal protein subunit S18 [Boletus reticuloceps]
MVLRWTSPLRTARQALHKASRPNGTPCRALSLSPDTPPTRTTPPHLEFPPTGPIPYDAVPNPLTRSKASALISKTVAPLPKHHFHAISSRNNTKIYLCGPDGKLLPQGWWSGGSCGFKGANRKSHEAGYQCAVHAFRRLEEVIKEKGRISLALHFVGFGKGRFAVEGVFLTSEGDRIRPLVVEVEDRTKIKIGGTRSKKKRRV